MHLVQKGRLGLVKDRKSQGSTLERSTCCSQMHNFYFNISTIYTPAGGKKFCTPNRTHPEVSKICWRWVGGAGREGRFGVCTLVLPIVQMQSMGPTCSYSPTSLQQVHNDCALQDTRRLARCYFPLGNKSHNCSE